jgi:hypothetical protein
MENQNKFALAMSILLISETDLAISKELENIRNRMLAVSPPYYFDQIQNNVFNPQIVNKIMEDLGYQLANSTTVENLEMLEKFYKSNTFQLVKTVIGPLMANYLPIIDKAVLESVRNTVNEMFPKDNNSTLNKVYN